MARRIGKCRLCGKEGALSFEHVPPKKAFNNEHVIAYSTESWLTKKTVRRQHFQGGAGAYTLCEQCNRTTGLWYATEFIRWSKIGADILAERDRQKDHSHNISEIAVTFSNVSPLRFLKEVVTCFFSVMNTNTDAVFATANPELVQFVLNRDENNLPENYRFYLKLYRKSIMRRYPIAGKISLTYTKTGDNISILAAVPEVFSEITHFPFVLIMTDDSEFLDRTEFTYFKNYAYDDRIDVSLTLSIGQGANPYPGSY